MLGIGVVDRGSAQARVEVGIGIGVPGYAVPAPPPLVYYEPVPVQCRPASGERGVPGPTNSGASASGGNVDPRPHESCLQ